jgi:hypothetical protein
MKGIITMLMKESSCIMTGSVGIGESIGNARKTSSPQHDITWFGFVLCEPRTTELVNSMQSLIHFEPSSERSVKGHD